MKPISIVREPERHWWTVQAACACGCGYVVGTGMGATVESAVWRYRQARRERWIIAGALSVVAREPSMSAEAENYSPPVSNSEDSDAVRP